MISILIRVGINGRKGLPPVFVSFNMAHPIITNLKLRKLSLLIIILYGFVIL